MIKVGLKLKGCKDLYIPSHEELITNHIDNQIRILIGEMVNGDFCGSRDIILSQNDDDYKKFICHVNTLKPKIPYRRVVNVGGTIYSYCVFVGSNLNLNRWTFIGKFDINGKLCIDDPCRFSGNDISYDETCHDSFYAFCYIEKSNGILSSVIIINEKMYHDLDESIFDLKDKMVECSSISVDSGSVAFCNNAPFFGSESRSYEDWYDKEICDRCYDKGHLLNIGGVAVNSGYGDGTYPLLRYADKNLNHLAFQIIFYEEDSLKVVTTRDITTSECEWLKKDVKKGEIYEIYMGPTYGCITSDGIAVDMNGVGVELPRSALRDMNLEDSYFKHTKVSHQFNFIN